jgi:hypothetical protein
MYVVVKNAGEDWQKFWALDPKETGVISIESAAHTFTGTVALCEEKYNDRESAEMMAVKIRALNPSNTYAVCPLVDTGFVLNAPRQRYGNQRLVPVSPFGEK